MKPSIVVIGSTNTDMVIKADQLPLPGETVLGGSFFMNPGGKGANQAVAAARLGGNVNFITKIGIDIFGKQCIQIFKDEGLITDYIITSTTHASGVALITIDKYGENCIAVASGANAALTPEDLADAKKEIENASIILMQLEIPVKTVDFIATTVNSKNTKIILNPAPATQLAASLLKNIYIISPNEKEAEMLSGISISDKESVIKAAAIIKEKGPQTVIITLGEKGVYILSPEYNEFIAAPKVIAEDTTAAGDVFNGALAVALSEKKNLKDAVHFACHAASLAVTKLGAQASAPYRKEVEDFMITQKQKTATHLS
jgi:ribokinase